MFPKILDRYIAKEVGTPALLALTVFSFLFLINALFQTVNMILQEGLDLGAAGLLFLYSLPALLAYTLPIAVLTGTIVAFGRLTADSEAVALRAAGLPVRQMLRAPLALGLAAGLFLLSLNLWLTPLARTGQQQLLNQATRVTNLAKMVKPRVFYDRIPGVLLYTDAVDRTHDRYTGVILYQRPSPEKDILTVSEWAQVVDSGEAGELQFLMGPGETTFFDRANPEKVQVSRFSEQALTVVPARPPEGAAGKDLYSLTVLELLGRLASPPSDAVGPLERSSWRYELHRRFAAAAAVLLFALLGVPLGLGNSRGGKGAAFTLSLLAVLGYWIVYSMAEDTALRGRVHPVVAAWFPCALLLAAGLLFLRLRGNRPVQAREWGWPSWMRWPGGASSEETPTQRAVHTPARFEGWLTVVDRYLLSHVARYFFLIAGAVLLLNAVIEASGFSEYLTSSEQWDHFGRYLAGQSAGLFLLVLPLTLLMTVLVSLGILEKGSELTALKAGGVSLYRISFTFLMLGAAVGAASWLLGDRVVPAANRAAQREKQALKKFVSRNFDSSYDVWLFSPGRGQLFHYEHYDSALKRFEGFSEYTLGAEGSRLEGRFYAENAGFVAEKTLGYDYGWRWSATGATRFTASAGGSLEAPAGQEYFVLPPYMEGRTLSTSQLSKLVRDLEEKGLPSSRQRMDYHRKFADAATPIALLLVGLPFAFRAGRRGSLYGVAIAVGLAILFYILQATFAAIGEMEWLDPALAAWAPATIFSLAGGFGVLNLRS